MNKWLRTVLVAGAVILLDQGSKLAVLKYVAPVHRIEVLPGFFNLTFVMNPGVAFGLLSGLPDGWRIWCLSGLALAALGIVLYFITTARREDRFFLLGLGLISGGAVGNQIDRLRLGAVIDFLDFYLASYHWNTFNVADIGITVGTGLILIHLWTHRHE